MSRVVRKAKKVNEKLGYGFYEGGCVFGTKLRPGSHVSESFSLRAGQSYVFIGSGDKTARNVDLILRDSKGHVVGQDIEADAAPFVLFRPNSTGRYTLSLHLKTGWSGPAFCALTILRKGGMAMPFERVVEAAIRMDYASWDQFRAAKGGRINEVAGTWALYGAVLKQGGVLSSTPKRFNAANRAIVAVGDSRVRSLGLALLDGQRKAVAVDAKGGATPNVTRNIGAGAYSILVSNKASAGPALVMALLLDIPPNAPQASAAAQATPASPTPAGQIGDFEGYWKGDWADEANGRSGSFKMSVQRDGTLSGHFSYPPLKTAAKFKGAVAADGAFQLTYTQSGKESVAEGTLKLSDDYQKIEGHFTFPEKETGSVGFTLVKVR